MTMKSGVIQILQKIQNGVATYSEPELPSQVAHVLHVWRPNGFGASEIFIVILANQVVSHFHVLKDTTCSIIIYIQRR